MLVAVRCRNLSSREGDLGRSRFPTRNDTGYCSVFPDAAAGKVHLLDPDSVDRWEAEGPRCRYDRTYSFDIVFDGSCSNEEVYDRSVRHLVEWVKKGYNGTCFAYGMTGAGKTFTMLGQKLSSATCTSRSSMTSLNPASSTREVSGICSLAAADLFHRCATDDDAASAATTIHVSYLEIYNERIQDLLVRNQSSASQASCRADGWKDKTSSSLVQKPLDVVEDTKLGIHVPGLKETLITTVQELEALLESGNDRRTKASTSTNSVSSRSHAILQLVIRRRFRLDDDPSSSEVVSGKLLLVDLAGSERAVGETDGQQKDRRLEGSKINKSLLALGNCITVLGSLSTAGPTAASNVHVPYRDSKLTRLLKESLGGNTRTVMIATVSPSVMCFEETVSTLKYATRAKSITRHVRRNVERAPNSPECDKQTEIDHSSYRQVIRSLSNEIGLLKARLKLTSEANLHLGSDPNLCSVSGVPSSTASTAQPLVGASAPVSRTPSTSNLSASSATNKKTEAQWALLKQLQERLKGVATSLQAPNCSSPGAASNNLVPSVNAARGTPTKQRCALDVLAPNRCQAAPLRQETHCDPSRSPVAECRNLASSPSAWLLHGMPHDVAANLTAQCTTSRPPPSWRDSTNGFLPVRRRRSDSRATSEGSVGSGVAVAKEHCFDASPKLTPSRVHVVGRKWLDQPTNGASTLMAV